MDFRGDKRIALIRRLVTDELGQFAEVEDEVGSKPIYSIQTRTLVGYRGILERWRELAKSGVTDESQFAQVVREEQAQSGDRFGSSELFFALARSEFHPIWRDGGSEPWHARDPLQLWMQYQELLREREAASRPIRFTPAHPVNSPRFLHWPKAGASGSKHHSNRLAFSVEVFSGDGVPYALEQAKIRYAAPRLKRDGLRSDSEETLEKVAWLQPMMAALGVERERSTDFRNCAVTLYARSRRGVVDAQVGFPLKVGVPSLSSIMGRTVDWSKQFLYWGKKPNRFPVSLLWPGEKGARSEVNWSERCDSFRLLAVDLGQRFAAAAVICEVRKGTDRYVPNRRWLGACPTSKGKHWVFGVERTMSLRLPGENQIVWRPPTKQEQERGVGAARWAEELFGSKGRSATSMETAECADIVAGLGYSEGEALPADWRESLSFPEQNDLLIALARRAQSNLARLFRWASFLSSDDKSRQARALEEIAAAEGVLAQQLRSEEGLNDVTSLRTRIVAMIPPSRETIRLQLLRIANRCMPLRNGQWDFRLRGDGVQSYAMTVVESKGRRVNPRGQRGLSMARIEQLEELRRRFQSLNRFLLRVPGEFASSNSGPMPEVWEELLTKLDRFKRERVNQTAHLILRTALGLELAAPDKARPTEVHGSYKAVRPPVDFIVIENLSRYLASQGRPRRENSRLMKWCHRQVREKLRQICEPFGLQVVETPPAYSSRFCSGSGVPGFRAVEVGPGFERQYPWRKLIASERANDRKVREYLFELKEIHERVNAGRKGKPLRKLLLPLAGGPVFIPLTDGSTEGRARIQQADFNAAINLGLRAVAHPSTLAVHSRVRATRKGKKSTFLVAEKRLAAGKKLTVTLPESVEIEGGTVNFFFDPSRATIGEKAGTLSVSEHAEVSVVASGDFWKAVAAQEWTRVRELNEKRLQRWRSKAESRAVPVAD